MRTPRQHLIDRAIVRALIQCGTYLCPERTLQETIGLSVTPLPLQSEFDASLRYLDEERRVLGIEGETGTKWKVTEAGRAWAAENRIA